MMENLTNEEAISDELRAYETEAAEALSDAAKQAESAEAADDKTESVSEEIVFQRIMDYKAYRRGMVMTRALITAVLAIAAAFTIRLNIIVGILLPVIVIIVGAIAILVSMNNERSYTVYNTRVVIKRRGDDKRKSVPLESIASVNVKSAFYEKRLCVGTVTIKAKNAKGRIKTYKLKHIFDAKPVAEYLTGAMGGRNTNADQN